MYAVGNTGGNRRRLAIDDRRQRQTTDRCRRSGGRWRQTAYEGDRSGRSVWAMIRRPTIAYNRHQSIRACSICGALSRRLAVAWRRLFALVSWGKCVKSAIIAHFFTGIFAPVFAWICRRSGRIEVNRPGPALNGIEPEYTRLHTRLLWYHRQLLAHTSAFQNTSCCSVCLPPPFHRLPSTPTAFTADPRT